MDKERVLVLPLGALALVALASKVHGRGFVHVRLPLVVTEHHLAVQLQLVVRDREAEGPWAGRFVWLFVCLCVCALSERWFI